MVTREIFIFTRLGGHYCFDVVVQDAEEPQGVLIRGLEPTVNQKQMTINRGMSGFNLSNGPAKLVQALGIHSNRSYGSPHIKETVKG